VLKSMFLAGCEFELMSIRLNALLEEVGRAERILVYGEVLSLVGALCRDMVDGACGARENRDVSWRACLAGQCSRHLVCRSRRRWWPSGSTSVPASAAGRTGARS
jgi:hypothetical protein